MKSLPPPFPSKPKARKRRRFGAPVLAALLAVPLLGVAISALFAKTEVGKHKVVTQISLIAPPPPPKPPEQKPPDPPKVKDEVKIEEPKPVDEPKQAPDEPPPGPLGLDSNGTGPGDGFGLAGRPGGHDITVGGGRGGGLGMTLFGSNAARHIAQELARDPRLKAANYRIEVRIWLAKDGHIEREEIIRGTGDRNLDAILNNALKQVSSVQQAVPQDLPQPLRIRVTSTDA